MDKRLPSSLMIVLLLLWGSALEAASPGRSPEESKSASPSAEAATPRLEAINRDILAISREIRSAHDRLAAAKAADGSQGTDLSVSIRKMRSLVDSLSKGVGGVSAKHADSRVAQDMSRNVANLHIALIQLETMKGTRDEDAAKLVLGKMFEILEDLVENVAEMPGGEGAIIGDCC